MPAIDFRVPIIEQRSPQYGQNPLPSTDVIGPWAAAFQRLKTGNHADFPAHRAINASYL
ncbi:MAG: hypothetical protein ACOYXU_08110 [Nitrospirota bacterium]